MSRVKRSLKKNAVLSLLVLLLSSALSSAPVVAAPEKAPELRKITYKYVLKAQEQMAEDNLEGARESLEYVLPRIQKSKFDKAAVHQMLGVVYANQERYEEAMKQFKAFPCPMMHCTGQRLSRFAITCHSC